ncbi:MAG TPA: hypothetical protein VD966_00075 [Pyrinomonadaceae bacterium]|nr:hypothetical protein [Pyrinomonadaceae bacterium]
MHDLATVYRQRALSLLISWLLLIASGTYPGVFAQNPTPRTPSETVREFYRAMREKRFREAFAMSIYKPAIEGLSAAEFEDLRPDFEKMAAAVPEKVEINGEQIKGETATVFVKIADGDTAAQAEPVTLLRAGGAWIVGDRENEKIVRASGKDFFFKARIDTHHSEVQSMLQRISLAQLAYSSQHDGQYADLQTLIKAGLIPKDIEGTETTGYRFHITLSRDGKSYRAGAEPAHYGRTGRLSFYLDPSGIRSGDVGGKPLILPAGKN